jgi:hypothetical protein
VTPESTTEASELPPTPLLLEEPDPELPPAPLLELDPAVLSAL